MRTYFVPSLLITGWLWLASSSTTLAKISEPDYIIWGTVTLNDQPVTADQTDVFITAQRGQSGPILDAYRMGDIPAAGNRYILRIPIESLDPLFDPVAAALGDPIIIAVSDFSGTRQTITRSATVRGEILQLNLNAGGTGDNNGLPDDWEIRYFGGNGQDAGADPDGDGKTTAEEFDLGTDPTNPNDVALLEINRLASLPQVGFLARAAAGPGYEGASRSYTLEFTANPGAEAWTPLPGYIDIIGADQPVSYEPPQTESRLFFRLRVTLQR